MSPEVSPNKLSREDWLGIGLAVIAGIGAGIYSVVDNGWTRDAAPKVVIQEDGDKVPTSTSSLEVEWPE